MDNIVISPMPFWDLFRAYLSLNYGHALTHPLYLKKGFAEAVKDVSSSIFMNSIDEIAHAILRFRYVLYLKMIPSTEMFWNTGFPRHQKKMRNKQ